MNESLQETMKVLLHLLPLENKISFNWTSYKDVEQVISCNLFYCLHGAGDVFTTRIQKDK